MKIKTGLILIILLALFITCQQNNSSDTSEIKKGMIKVTILYPNGEGNTFDMQYYSNKHMPMIDSLFGASLKQYKIDKGLAGRSPDEPVPYLAIGYLYFETLADYENSFGPHAETIVGDIPNYTNSQPIIQISEIVE